MKARTLAIYVFLALWLFSCQKEKDTTFLITKDSVGKLKRKTLVQDLETIYAQDSLVRDTLALNIANRSKKIQVFEKGGKRLLTLTPNTNETPTIENVRIHDPRFVTEKGVSVSSTFKDIREKHSIKKVLTSLHNVLIILKDSKVYFTIDKEELPSSLRYASSVNIEAVQIPDKAKIKYMMVAWD